MVLLLLLLLLGVARMRTPADSLMLRRLDFTHGRWRIDMWRRNVMSIRVLLLLLPMARLRDRRCYIGHRVSAPCRPRRHSPRLAEHLDAITG